MIVSYLSLALLLSLERGGAIGWRTPPLVIRIITPLQGSNIELRFAANYNLPLCVIGHLNCSHIGVVIFAFFVIKLKARMQRIMLICGHLFCTA